jgi:hypothetical protein
MIFGNHCVDLGCFTTVLADFRMVVLYYVVLGNLVIPDCMYIRGWSTEMAQFVDTNLVVCTYTRKKMDERFDWGNYPRHRNTTTSLLPLIFSAYSEFNR